MAFTRINPDSYGQVELNNVAFRRDGRIEAQCKPGDDFKNIPVENGMLLSVDNIKRIVTFPKEGYPVALVYSTEHMYDPRTPGLKNFKLNGTDDFYPRLGYLAVGDKFYDNCVSFSSDGITDLEALKSAYVAGGAFGVPCSENGTIKLVTADPGTGICLRVVNVGTMPDGSVGIQFQAVRV